MKNEAKPVELLDLWATMQALRSVRLMKLNGRAPLAEEQPTARLIAVLRDAATKLLAIANESDASAGPQLVEWAWEEYLRNEWGASLAPPFALSGFANVVMLSRLWPIVEQRIHEEAQLRAREEA